MKPSLHERHMEFLHTLGPDPGASESCAPRASTQPELILVVRPLLLVVRPGAPSSFLLPMFFVQHTVPVESFCSRGNALCCQDHQVLRATCNICVQSRSALGCFSAIKRPAKLILSVRLKHCYKHGFAVLLFYVFQDHRK